MLKKIIVASILIFTFISCNSGKTKNIIDKEVANISEFEYPSDLKTFVGLFPNYIAPLEINTKFTEDATKNNFKYKLTSNQVKLLTQNISKDEMTEINDYYLSNYFKIEEAKADKNYDQYIEKLDIGMIKDVNCYALGKIQFGDSVSVLIWKMEFTSIEACPYYYGTNFMTTIVSRYGTTQTYQIACKQNAADAPMSSETFQDFSISKNGIVQIKSETTVLEEDLEVEHNTNQKTYLLTKRGFVKK